MTKYQRIFLWLLAALALVYGITTLLPKREFPQTGEFPELSAKEYAAAKDRFLKLAEKQNPQFALAQLREEIQTSKALLRSCHALAHGIGHAAYKKYGDFGAAMRYQDEICNSGYLHGIIEAHFSKSSDISAAMQTVCSALSADKFAGWECYHGAGHGLMYYSENDLPASLAMCDRYKNALARGACSNGVFMENFNTDQKLHPSAFLKASDPFYPCAEQAGRHKGDCYLYAPTYYLSLNKNQYARALFWCEGAEPGYIGTCAYGVGTQAMKENINEPKLVETACMSNSTLTPSCIRGMVGLYMNHHGAAEPARELCQLLKETNRGICTSHVEARAFSFK